MERPRFTEHLEAIKFICKDFWSELFKKQIDNLKTNHRVSHNKNNPPLVVSTYPNHMHCFCWHTIFQGTFVLQDNRFRWLMRIPVDASLDNMDSPSHRYQSSGDKSMTQALSLHLYFPCGIIRGALSNLGIPCAVSADISNLPACELNRGSGNRASYISTGIISFQFSLAANL